MTSDYNGVCEGSHYRQLWSYTLFGYKIERWVRQLNVFEDADEKHFVINWFGLLAAGWMVFPIYRTFLLLRSIYSWTGRFPDYLKSDWNKYCDKVSE